MKIIDQCNTKEIEQCPFPTGIAKIDLNKLEYNISQISKFANRKKKRPVKFLLPIKANAYGHGIMPIAKFVEHKKLCSYFGVAHACEAYNLRKNGIKLPILIMGQVYKQEEIKYIIQNNIEQVISDQKNLQHLNEEANKLNKIALLHLSVDTGMGRCGVLFKNFVKVLEAINNCKNIKLIGVMTHFSVADSLKKEALKYTEEQINKFTQVKKVVLNKHKDSNIVFHTSNSSGSIGHASSVFDMIRPGIAAYGYPRHDVGLKLQTVMTLASKITLIKKYPKGHSIGYGRTYKTKINNEILAIVPIGYGDGLSRLLSNNFTPIVNGQKVKSIGKISMDQFSILVNKKVKVGDLVQIIGKNNGVKNDAHDIAKNINSITYEILCNIGNSKRIRHEYVYTKKP